MQQRVSVDRGVAHPPHSYFHVYKYIQYVSNYIRSIFVLCMCSMKGYNWHDIVPACVVKWQIHEPWHLQRVQGERGFFVEYVEERLWARNISVLKIPNCLYSQLLLSSNKHSCSTRGPFTVPESRTQSGQQRVLYRSVATWNLLILAPNKATT